ncbi:MAG: deoxyribonuclease IV [Erysipelotrichaceae bacterium]|nr:deoxyribonuclease IV [Erysipelotrichaceae bacterium]
MKIGSHVSVEAPDYFLSAVKTALEYNANAFMIYTGAPQNSFRQPIEKLKIEEGRKLWEESGNDIKDVIIHSPYIINLANTEKPETFQLAKEVLAKEVKRTEAIGAKYLVLHPGASLKADIDTAVNKIVEGLDEVLAEKSEVIIALETMAGKGSEVGRTFEELQMIIERCAYPERLGVCLDSCHIHDGGYDLGDLDAVLKQFDEIIGLNRLNVIHVNDSKNEIGAHKDRHANLGAGFIGFEKLYNLVHHPLLDNIAKILETPYIDGKAPYREEIEMLRTGNWYQIPGAQ